MGIPERFFFLNFLAILGDENTTPLSLTLNVWKKTRLNPAIAMVSLWQKSLCKGLQCTPYHLIMKGTLQGINISHLGKRKIIFKMPFLGIMLSSPSQSQTIPTSFSIAHMFCQTQVTRQTQHLDSHCWWSTLEKGKCHWQSKWCLAPGRPKQLNSTEVWVL